jgi:DNA-binding NarL/FixJ family response regulator
MEEIRLLVADDHEVIRTGIRNLLETQPGWQVVAEVSNGREALEKARDLKPDVAVLDITMPVLNGLEAAKQMLKEDMNSRILVLTVHESDVLIQDVLNAGAKGCVLKSDAARDLVTAVEAICHNKPFFTAKVTQIVTTASSDSKKIDKTHLGPNHRLTPRQREVIQLLAEGKSNKEVAAALGVSVKTAETHRANIMQRLEYHSISELVRYALRNDIIAV